MDELTQEQLINARYDLAAAPIDTWRSYDENNPIPGYYDFDWLSARYPDLYHKFALSSLGLMDELDKLFDFTGLEVLDIGAGTGRTTLGAARKAKKVIAVDPFGSVLRYGRELAQQAGFDNVDYVRGDSACLPFPDGVMDAAICAWAMISHPEAYRVLKPGGALIDLLPVPGAFCGELTPLMAEIYPAIVTEIAPAHIFDPSCPIHDFSMPDDTWNSVPVTPPIRVRDFTYVADYEDVQEAAAILGRLFGPQVKRYMLEGRKSTVSWRLRIVINRVKK